MLEGWKGTWSCRCSVPPRARDGSGAAGEQRDSAAGGRSERIGAGRSGEMIETGERCPRVGESGHSAVSGETIGSFGWVRYWCWGLCARVIAAGARDWFSGAKDSGWDDGRGERGEMGEPGVWFVGDIGWVGCWKCLLVQKRLLLTVSRPAWKISWGMR